MNTYGDIGNATAGWYSRRLLSHAIPVLVLERFGLTKVLPPNETKVIEFRRSQPFTPATIPLVEGVTPDGSDFGYDTVTAQVVQYGDYSGLTDVVKDTSRDQVLRDMAVRQGEQIGETREALTWAVLRNGTSVRYAGSKTARGALDKTAVLDVKLQRSCVTDLRRNKAKKFTSILAGSDKFESYAVEACYVGVSNTDIMSHVRNLKGVIDADSFVPVARYGSQRPLSPHEAGSFEEVRYILSPDLSPFKGAGAAAGDDAAKFRVTGGKFDVYPVLYLGREAFGCIPLRGKGAVRPMVLNPNVPRGGDPLGQRGTIAWKMWFACKVLNEAWMRRAETVCSI